jgi:hypothetical protein
VSRLFINSYALTQAAKSMSKWRKESQILFCAWAVFMAVIFFRYTEDHMKLPIRVTRSMEVYRPGEDELLWNGLIIPMIVVTVIWMIAEFFFAHRAKIQNHNRMETLKSKSSDVTPEEFLSKRMWFTDKGDKVDFTGVFVLHNLTKDKFFVGHSIHVLERVRQYFIGQGNGDVYADWKMGDKFIISTLSLGDSGHKDLNELEQEIIEAYDARERGYNKK